MNEIIKLLKERILLAEKKKGEYDTLEMDAFWDGQMRCAQDMLNKVSRLTKRAADGVVLIDENGEFQIHLTNGSSYRWRPPHR